jgi:hypothetical protein
MKSTRIVARSCNMEDISKWYCRDSLAEYETVEL